MLTDTGGDFAQPAQDLLLLLRQPIAGEGWRKILLEEQGRLPPCVRQRTRREGVFIESKRLVEPGQVILHRRHGEEPAGARQVPAGAHQCQVVLERAVPSPALPRHRPATTTTLDFHLGLVNRPRGHRLRSCGILRDDGFQHRERESRIRVGFELTRIERQLPRAFADGMRERFPEVARGQIDAVGAAHVRREIPRQLPFEALEVPSERSEQAGIVHRPPRRSGPGGRRAPRPPGRA